MSDRPNAGAMPCGPSHHEQSPSVSAVPVGVSIADDWPPIEYDDCYPEDESFSAWNDLPFSFQKAGQWLLSELPRACEYMCCFCEVARGHSGYSGKPIYQIHFSTGGWSGAESIMALIERRVDLSYYMMSWQRGGHYVFEVPAQGTSASGHDPQGHGATPAGPVGETDAPTTTPETHHGG